MTTSWICHGWCSTSIIGISPASNGWPDGSASSTRDPDANYSPNANHRPDANHGWIVADSATIHPRNPLLQPRVG